MINKGLQCSSHILNVYPKNNAGKHSSFNSPTEIQIIWYLHGITWFKFELKQELQNRIENRK
jgi:hypothetical protein